MPAEQLLESESEHETEVFDETPTAGMIPRLLPMEDLSAAALAGEFPPAIHTTGETITGEGATGSDLYDQMARALYRRVHPHVVVTGLKGVGKSTAVRELARRAATGEIPFLRDKRFVVIDCHNVPPADSRSCLEAICSAVAPVENLVLCLEGMASLLRSPPGESTRPMLLALLNQPGLQVVGVLSDWDYSELIGGDAGLLEVLTRVEVFEPREEAAVAIARQAADGLEADYALQISSTVVQRAVELSSSYLLNENLPARAIKVLRRACDEVDYERTQRNGTRSELRAADLCNVIARLTGIPEETIAGETRDSDFALALGEAVVGQEQAVQGVAAELRLIKAGLADAGKPASVLLLAGMTGVGKTELAKRVAELYSTSKRLQTYTMGNFVDPHSVSGIIGVPPGYVGHENGGRLINELQADPYGVFLLDEAEKAHPNVWKPFLNLFDEGWIADQRGVKAYADRTIFILTTNAGDDTIAQMTRQGKSQGEIIERARQILSKIRPERSSQPVFTPQFLARIRRILVFNSLDEAAMIDIGRKLVRRLQRVWKQKRDKRVTVADELIVQLGRHAHLLNERSGGKEGGRIVQKLMVDVVESAIQDAALVQRDAYSRCETIEVRPANVEAGAELLPGVVVEFG